MSSPRGLLDGGIGCIGTVVVPNWGDGGGAGRRLSGEELLPGGLGDVGEEERGGLGVSSGRGKKKESGFRGNFERSGGLRTLRRMLNERSARLACGTYLRNAVISTRVSSTQD